MTSSRALSTTVLLGFALCAVVLHLGLLATDGLWSASVPVAFVLAFIAWRPPVRVGLPGWLWTVLIACAVPVIAGAVLTLDRSPWDGYCAWSQTAGFLGEAGGLDQPFFRDPSVYNYTRPYPLLQPALLASLADGLGPHGARVLFPAVYLLFVGLVYRGLARPDVPPRVLHAGVALAASTPLLLGPGHGAVDSGFAELLHLTWLTAGAVAIVRNDPRAALCAALLLPLTKTEGAVHAGLLALVAFTCGRRESARAAGLGAGIGLALWLPLLVRLNVWERTGELELSAGILGLCLPLALLATCELWGCARRRPRYLPAAIVVSGAFVAAVLFAAPRNPVLGTVIHRAVGLDLNWAGAGDVALAWLEQAVNLRKFGLLFVLLPALWMLARRPAPDAALLLGLIGAGLFVLGVFQLTLPAQSLDLFLREGAPRQFLQWIGPAWLAVGLLAAQVRLDRRVTGEVPVEESPSP